jgi:itaconyl-CoA hydratase
MTYNKDSVNLKNNEKGWEFREGPFYEDLQVGEEIYHPRGRTLDEADCKWISLIAGDRNQIHLNKLYTAKYYPEPPFNGNLVVNGLFVLMIVNSLTSPETSLNGVFLGLDKVRMLSPVFIGDTLTAKSKVLEKRVSRSRAGFGIVKIHVQGFKNLNTEVINYDKTFMLPLKSREVS